jgi:hypothetical protein
MLYIIEGGLINVKSVRIGIMQMPDFREIVKTPRNIKISDDAKVLDILALLDQEYSQKIGFHRKDRPKDFKDDRICSLLQLLWDPVKQNFYDDVAVEARTAPPESEPLPIEQDWRTPIPDGSWIILAPDSGC